MNQIDTKCSVTTDTGWTKLREDSVPTLIRIWRRWRSNSNRDLERITIQLRPEVYIAFKQREQNQTWHQLSVTTDRYPFVTTKRVTESDKDKVYFIYFTNCGFLHPNNGRRRFTTWAKNVIKDRQFERILCIATDNDPVNWEIYTWHPKETKSQKLKASVLSVLIATDNDRQQRIMNLLGI